MDLKDVKTLVKKWYSGFIPRSMNNFILSNFLVHSSIIPQSIGVNAPLNIVNDTYTAYTDGKTISISAYYLLEEFYVNLDIPEDMIVHAAIACFNGSHLHEALHLQLTTPFDFKEAVLFAANENHYLYPCIDIAENKQIFSNIFNIVEDIYIEAQSQQKYESINRFILAKSEILFGIRLVEKAYNKIVSTGITNAVDQIMALLPYAKNKNTFYNSDIIASIIPPSIATIIENVRNSSHLSMTQRVWAAYDIYNQLLINDDSGDSKLMQEEAKDNSGSGGGDGGSGLSTTKSSSDDLALGLANAEENITEEQLIDAKESFNIVYREKLAKEEQKEKKLENIKRNEAIGNYTNVPSIKVVDIKKLTYRDNSTPDPVWLKLSRLLRYIRQPKTTPARPAETGKSIIKQELHRIATDGKIMASGKAKVKKPLNQEIIILIDASGSMSAGGLFKKCLDVAHGAFIALMTSNIPCSVYAHTSYGAGLTPIIYKIASYNMPLDGKELVTTTDYKKRFAHATGIDKNENFDGIILWKMCDFFSDTEKKKTIIVLSDGQPAGGRLYSGIKAIDHTKTVVKNINKKGINIIPISLVKSVVEYNIDIYGKANHLEGFSDTLEETFRELVYKISTQ